LVRIKVRIIHGIMVSIRDTITVRVTVTFRDSVRFMVTNIINKK